LSSDNENIIKVVCPSCNTTAPVEHINIQDKIAKCGGCDSVFSFGEAVATKLQTRVSNDEIPRPAGVELYEFENARRSWCLYSHEYHSWTKTPADHWKIYKCTKGKIRRAGNGKLSRYS